MGAIVTQIPNKPDWMSDYEYRQMLKHLRCDLQKTSKQYIETMQPWQYVGCIVLIVMVVTSLLISVLY